MHLVLFDIDGTLVDSSDYETRLYSEAIEEVLDTPFERDWSRYRNVTDGGILDEIVETNGLTNKRDDIHTRVRARFVEKTKHYFQDNPAAVREIPGAKSLVERLSSRRSCVVAIATGGWEETARLKLSSIGVDSDSIPLASGSDATSRVEIMTIAEKRALGDARPHTRTYFGDAIWDKLASESLGFNFVAVGNSISHSTQFSDLRAHEEILDQLGI